MNLEQLPIDIFINIFKYLYKKDINSLYYTNKKLKKIIQTMV
jgi:hypothetical protein